jgi:hypothetical protein
MCNIYIRIIVCLKNLLPRVENEYSRIGTPTVY